MNKRLMASFVLIALVATGAFAQLAIGVSGALYSDSEQSANDIIKLYQEGDGVFYGPFIELGLGKLAVGLSANFSFYQTDIGEMMDMDFAGYLQAHLFRYKSFFDPFLEAGIGQMSTDYANSAEDTDDKNPLVATNYWYAGAGLGINLGGLGFFFKGLYNFELGDPAVGKYQVDDGNGSITTVEYDIAAYPLKNLRFLLGLKFIL
jgi:hypothetical protein